MKLKDKTAIVTGGAGCIGSAIVNKLGEEGARIAVFDLDESAMKEQRAALAAKNIHMEPVPVNICDYEQVQKAVSKVKERFGKIDILVNNAGVSARKEMRAFADQKLEVVRRVIELNLFGTLHCIHAVLPSMIEAQSGKIVNIASLVGVNGVWGNCDYGAAKAGVILATKTLAIEVARKNININCVSPGKVPRQEDIPEDEEAFARQFTFLSRMCTGRDIAEMTVFLATEAASYITGQNFIVDGGRSLGLKGDYCGDCRPCKK